MYDICCVKGPDNVDFENEKWLDVNVISSLLNAFFRTDYTRDGICNSMYYLLFSGTG